MVKLTWDRPIERVFETGLDHGVLYLQNALGEYDRGFVWNGLTAVTESPSGAEASPQYADNIKYLNLVSAEEFAATIEAFTYPDEFEECDGTASPEAGVYIGQQARKTFGFSYRTLVGNNVEGQEAGYKLHLVYGCLAAPTEKARTTINDSPEATTFSWEVSTTPVEVPGYKPSATLTVDSTKVSPVGMSQLENILYGTTTEDPRLPLPAEVLELISTTIAEVTPVDPTYDSETDTVTVPNVTGVVYLVDGTPVTDTFVISEDTTVTAEPAPGYVFAEGSETSWLITFV